MFNDFDKTKYDIVSIDNVASMSEIEALRDKYKDRYIAYRYDVLSGHAEILLRKR